IFFFSSRRRHTRSKRDWSSDVCSSDLAPLIVKKAYEKKENIRLILNNWFKGRGIPTFRDQLDLLLSRLSLSAPEELLDKAFALRSEERRVGKECSVERWADQ